MAAKTFHYFSFGSNLLRQRLLLANPSAVYQAVGKLEGYKLVFIGHGKRWQGGLASIRERKGGEVWGVVWKLNIADMASLDRQEGIYTPIEVKVTGLNGESYTCRTYQLLAADFQESSSPSPHYKDVIVKGARQNQLPPHYLQMLEDIVDNGYQGDVPVYNDVMKMLADTSI